MSIESKTTNFSTSPRKFYEWLFLLDDLERKIDEVPIKIEKLNNIPDLKIRDTKVKEQNNYLKKFHENYSSTVDEISRSKYAKHFFEHKKSSKKIQHTHRIKNNNATYASSSTQSKHAGKSSTCLIISKTVDTSQTHKYLAIKNFVELAVAIEEIGCVDEVSKKLFITLGTLRNVKDYLRAFISNNQNIDKLFYSACDFQIPIESDWDSKPWAILCQKKKPFHYLLQERFRNILSRSYLIQTQIRLENKSVRDVVTEKMSLEDLKYISAKYNPNTTIQNSREAAIWFNYFNINDTTRKRFSKMKRTRSNLAIPNVKPILSDDLGLEKGYILRKLDEQNDAHLIALAGNFTSCCQKLEDDETVVRYSLESEYGGVYAIFNPDKRMVAQCFVWRAEDNGILVFDSVEAHVDYTHISKKNIIGKMMLKLSSILTDSNDYGIKRVYCGGSNSLSFINLSPTKRALYGDIWPIDRSMGKFPFKTDLFKDSIGFLSVRGLPWINSYLQGDDTSDQIDAPIFFDKFLAAENNSQFEAALKNADTEAIDEEGRSLLERCILKNKLEHIQYILDKRFISKSFYRPSLGSSIPKFLSVCFNATDKIQDLLLGDAEFVSIVKANLSVIKVSDFPNLLSKHKQYIEKLICGDLILSETNFELCAIM